jgi:hypothetical protein
MEWYIKKGIPLDVEHFLNRAIETNDWEKDEINEEEVLELIRNKIDGLNFKNVKEDVIRFIPNDQALEIWSADYFLKLIEKLKFK